MVHDSRRGTSITIAAVLLLIAAHAAFFTLASPRLLSIALLAGLVSLGAAKFAFWRWHRRHRR
jgi:predicted outer membrane protein